MADKLKGGRKVIRAVQSLHHKIGSSKAAELLQGECADLEQKLAVATACVDLLGLRTKPPNPAELVDHLAVMRNDGALVSANLHMLECPQKLRHALTLNDVRGPCQMCFQGSTELGRLCEHGCSVEAAARVATSSFLDSILMLATAGCGKPEPQRQTTSPTKSATSSNDCKL